jgi:nitroreductase
MANPNPALVALVSQAGDRAAETPVSSLFIGRWSSRALTGEAIPDETLFALFEAARFAPSYMNSQPWRFAFARRGEPAFDRLAASLLPGNQIWAKEASALVLVASKAAFTPPGASEPILSPASSFDTGAAWASLALQASLLGWSTRAMAGFDKDKARAATGAPESLKLEAVIAIGKRGDPTLLPEERQPMEKPSPRKKMADIVFAGGFPPDC